MAGYGGKESMMCGGSMTRRKSGFGHREIRRVDRGPFGLDVEEMSARARVVTGIAVLVPVMLSGLLLVAFVPELWWVFTTYGWVAFPAFGLLLKGLAGAPPAVSDSQKLGASDDGERQLLEALRERGEITSTRAAMETSLSVAEADATLRELADGGHLEVRVRGGTLVYALWGRPVALEGEEGGT